MEYKPEKESVVLVVDDSPTILHFLREVLKADYQVFAEPSGERALAFLEECTPNLILLDVTMQGMSGYDVIAILKKNCRWANIPVVFLTSMEGRDNEQKAFDLGAVDYILKPISAGVVRARVRTHVELEAYRRNLEHMVKVKTHQLELTQDSILDMLSNVTAYRDNETGAHIKRTTVYMDVILKHMRAMNRQGYTISQEYEELIVKSAKLHDLGKVAVPDSILLKPVRLSEEEFAMIKKHTILGAEIIDSAIANLGDASPFLNVAREIVISHHEWWNGDGYPYKLSGDAIPISGRVMAIADVYDALISRRPYKEPLSHKEAVEIIMEYSGVHFDPNIVDMCKDIFDGFPIIAEAYKDDQFLVRMLA